MAIDPSVFKITQENGREVVLSKYDLRSFQNYENSLTIEMADGAVYKVQGAPDINTFFASLFNLPPLDINISTIPAITIQDIVNLNVDSLPPITGTVAISSVGGTINITTAQQSLTYTMNQVNVANVSVSVLAANANRKHLYLRNQHLSGDIYIFFGATATLTNGLLVQNGETFKMPDEDGFIYKGAISAISANATAKPLLFLEGV